MIKSLQTYRRLVFILFSILVSGVYPLDAAENPEFITTETWEQVTEGADYTETYRERKKRKKKDKEQEEKKKRKKKERNKLFSLPGFNINIWKALLIIGIVLVLGIVIYYILKNAFNFFEDEKPEKSIHAQVENLDEDLHKADFKSLILQALEQKEYKLAIRIYYLQIIKLLSDQKLINWKRDKTNRVYIREMSQYKEGLVFSSLTRVYEQVWFGQNVLAHEEFQAMEPYFSQFLNKIPDIE